jgi:hypothetical protein
VISVREVYGWNLSPDTDYPDYVLTFFSSVFPGKDSKSIPSIRPPNFLSASIYANYSPQFNNSLFYRHNLGECCSDICTCTPPGNHKQLQIVLCLCFHCITFISSVCEEAGLEDLQLCEEEGNEIYLRSPDSSRDAGSLTREEKCKEKEIRDNLEPNFKEHIRPYL